MTKLIAEIGINHGGSLEKAIKIADSAIKSGAEVVKHQTHILYIFHLNTLMGSWISASFRCSLIKH